MSPFWSNATILISVVGGGYVGLANEGFPATENAPHHLLCSFQDSENQNHKELKAAWRHNPGTRLVLRFVVLANVLDSIGLAALARVLHTRVCAIVVVILNHTAARVSCKFSGPFQRISLQVFCRGLLPIGHPESRNLAVSLFYPRVVHVCERRCRRTKLFSIGGRLAKSVFIQDRLATESLWQAVCRHH